MPSPRLQKSTIADLVTRFVGGCNEEKKRGPVDSLGLHPANHAEFVYQLARYHGDGRSVTFVYDYLTYADLARPALEGFMRKCESSSDPCVKV